MKCPRCVQRIHRAAAACPHCGFSLSELDERFGSECRRISRLADEAGLMRRTERDSLEAMMDRFEQRFPQCFFAVHTGSAARRGELRQFGLWLLNRAAFEDIGPERPNEQAVLLCIDPEQRAAGLSWGYGLDPFLRERDTLVMLRRAHAYFVEGRYGEGTRRVIDELARLLARRARQARRDPERFKKPFAARQGGARTIRDGHRKQPGTLEHR